MSHSNQEILDDNYKSNIMQTADTLYNLGETTSLRLQILTVTRELHCVLIVTRASCHMVERKCQSKSD